MKLQIIIGTTRPGRVTDRVAEWTANELKQLTDAEVEIVDLAEFDLPMLNEPVSPRYNPDRKPEGVVKAWLDTIAQADGYVIVTPEYNRSMPGVLKNAIDYLDFQMDNKPVPIVAHGSAGGGQAVANLRNAIPGVNAFTVPTVTYIPGRPADMMSEDGVLNADIAANPYGPGNSIKGTLNSLIWYVEALTPAREAVA